MIEGSETSCRNAASLIAKGSTFAGLADETPSRVVAEAEARAVARCAIRADDGADLRQGLRRSRFTKRLIGYASPTAISLKTENVL
jgi:hypothetical protein